jgi:hypothetical protein
MDHSLASDIKTSPVLFFPPVVYVQIVYIPCTFTLFVCCNKRHATSSGFASIYSSSASFVLKYRCCISPEMTTVLQLAFFPRQCHPVFL